MAAALDRTRAFAVIGLGTNHLSYGRALSFLKRKYGDVMRTCYCGRERLLLLSMRARFYFILRGS